MIGWRRPSKRSAAPKKVKASSDPSKAKTAPSTMPKPAFPACWNAVRRRPCAGLNVHRIARGCQSVHTPPQQTVDCHDYQSHDNGRSQQEIEIAGIGGA